MTGYHRDMEQDVRIASAFVQNEWKMNVLTMLVGARLDKHNLIDKLIFSPRVNLLYKPADDFQARLTYSTGFRAPQAYDEDLHVTAVGGKGVQIKLSDNLREERSNSYSGSVDWTAHLGHWQANILVEGFYTDLRHVFVLEDIGKNEVGDVIKGAPQRKRRTRIRCQSGCEDCPRQGGAVPARLHGAAQPLHP